MSGEYKPIPMAVAQQLSRDHDKDVVVVISWSREHQKYHVTTFGRSPEDKDNAADLADTVAFDFLGLDEIDMHEDFRSPQDHPVRYLDGRSDR